MRLSSRSLGLAAAVAVVGIAWVLRPGAPRASAPTAGERIIAFGDSLVEGRGSTPGKDFVAILSRRLGKPIINAGRSGDTSRSALDRLDRDVLSRNPRIVIVLLGGNDFLRRLPTDETFRNLSTIVERIRGRGAAVVLVGVSVGLLSDPYAREYENLARRSSAGLVPDVLDGILGRPDRMADAIHPNDDGYRLVAERIEPLVRDLLRPDD
jgi:lysophospholipase L1-like esterase